MLNDTFRELSTHHISSNNVSSNRARFRDCACAISILSRIRIFDYFITYCLSSLLRDLFFQSLKIKSSDVKTKFFFPHLAKGPPTAKGPGH